VLHIGYPKTGTTSLQQFLDANRERLREHGVLYPSPSPQHNLAWSMSGTGASGSRGAPGYLFDPESLTFERLAEQIARSAADVVVLSSEEFVHRASQTAAVRTVERFASEVGASIDVIVFIRPQYAYINSLYTQRARYFNERRSFEDFAREAVGLRLINYSKRLRAWDQAPNLRLIPVPFTKSRMQPNLEAVFFDVAGLSDCAGSVLEGAERRRVNTSPGAATVEVFRRLTGHLDQLAGARNLDRSVRSSLSHYVTRICQRRIDWDTIPFNGLDNGLREQIDEHFAASNNAFARHHWGADWHDAFEADYERDLIPNEFDPARADKRTRRAVKTVTRLAIKRADALLSAPRPRSATAAAPSTHSAV